MAENELTGPWTHSHEEDEGDLLVFRRPAFAFPPSRGRTSFILLPGGELRSSAPGPDDRPSVSSGRWGLERRLSLTTPDGPAMRYLVERVEDDRLVLRPLG